MLFDFFFFLIKSHCRQVPDSKVQFSLARSVSQPWAVVSADPSGNGLSKRQVGREKTSSWETEIPLCGCLSTGVPLPRWERLKGGGDGRGKEEELALTGCPLGLGPTACLTYSALVFLPSNSGWWARCKDLQGRHPLSWKRRRS